MVKFGPIQRWLKDIPIARKLYFTIGIMVCLITIELLTMAFAVTTLSSVRSYVGGEGLWSKAQKDAVFHLRIYTYSHDENDYQDFLAFLKVPLGDSRARAELMKKNPDLSKARQGFIEGRNHPDDVDGMITLFRRFHWVSYIHKAIEVWAEAEKVMMEIIPIGEKLHEKISSGHSTQADIDPLLKQLRPINARLTRLEDEFSFTLGEGSRWLESLVLKLLIALTLSVEVSSILIAISISRGIEKGLKEIISGADLIAKGQLSTRVRVFSKDEIGVLASAFNQMTDTLEQNIRILAQTEENLRREKERAENSEKAKRIFLANMSHEIRTPMNAILGFARLLEDSEMEKEQKEYIHSIVKSGDSLLAILNDILDFAKIEAGKVRLEKVPMKLRDILQSTVMMLGPKARAKNIMLDFDIDQQIPEQLLGDPLRLSQILLNLISNGIKFAERGSVYISVRELDEKAEDVLLEFSVVDTGIGVKHEMQQAIFESFEQAEEWTTRKYGGTGLGLSIVKELVEMQGGKVYLSSSPGKGSDFRFTLKYQRFAEEPLADVQDIVPVSLADQKKLIRVLVVEDQPLNQLLMSRILRKRGFEFEVSENGLIALEKYSQRHFDIILMDLQMPQMDGYETTVRIREMKEEDKKHVPIIAMTAHTITGEKEKCLAIGMNDFISKPFDPDDLEKRMWAQISRDKA